MVVNGLREEWKAKHSSRLAAPQKCKTKRRRKARGKNFILGDFSPRAEARFLYKWCLHSGSARVCSQHEPGVRWSTGDVSGRGIVWWGRVKNVEKSRDEAAKRFLIYYIYYFLFFFFFFFNNSHVFPVNNANLIRVFFLWINSFRLFFSFLFSFFEWDSGLRK